MLAGLITSLSFKKVLEKECGRPGGRRFKSSPRYLIFFSKNSSHVNGFPSFDDRVIFFLINFSYVFFEIVIVVFILYLNYLLYLKFAFFTTFFLKFEKKNIFKLISVINKCEKRHFNFILLKSRRDEDGC